MKTWWPVFAGGVAGPLAALVLSQWMPRPWAAALGFSLAWFVAGLLFLRRPPVPGWTLGRWMAACIAGGAIAGVLTAVLY